MAPQGSPRVPRRGRLGERDRLRGVAREGSDARTRLDAFLARAGLGTRSEVRRLIRRGRVALDGVPCRRAADLVSGRVVTLDGEVVDPAPDAVHLALHKPAGFACSHDPAEAPIVDELLPAAWLRLGLHPAGRLDRATSGLLVLSTDGRVVHALTHPARKVAKRYRVRFEGRLPDDAAARAAEGLVIAGSSRPTRPARLEVEAPDRATIWIREGRFHQVRRMFARLGVRVVALHRDRIGDYALPEELGPGDYRPLSASDLERLRNDSTL